LVELLVCDDVDVPDAVDDLDEFDGELPPQAVASMHAAPSATNHAKAFIGTLFITPLLTVRRSPAGR
jgi:hypothetical protein